MAATQTAANGSYTISGLDPGSYVVKFVDCNDGSYATQFFQGSPDESGALAVPVGREQDVPGIDATLVENGRISGTVTGPSNEDLDDICVVALDAGGNQISEDRTEGGDYELTGIPQGQYRVHFIDCESHGFVDEYYDDQATFAAADLVSVSAATTTANVDAQLSSAGAIAGVVEGPGSEPAADVCVVALSLEGEEKGSARTDGQGLYAITQLAPGAYKVLFRDCSGGNLATEFYNDMATFTDASLVTVDEGLQTRDVDAVLAAGGSISGDVTAEGDAPAADVCISAFPAADAVYPVATTSSDGDGHYSLTGLGSGSYRVYFDGSCSLEQLSEEFFEDAATFAAATAVTVTAPADHGDLDVDLTATQAPDRDDRVRSRWPDGRRNPDLHVPPERRRCAECSIDQGTASYAPCSSALSHTPATNLADGSWTFRVRVSNAAGVDVETRAFTVDTTAPAVGVSSGPTGPTVAVRPAFGFTAEAGSAVLCSIDTGTANYGPCSGATSHTPSSDLAQGSYTFRVRATDAAGNSAVSTRGFSVDTTKPAVSITGGPTGTTNDLRPTFTFSAESGATVVCSLDSGTESFAACSGPGATHTPAADLAQGTHTFRVRATDAAGNTDTATRTFTVDTVAPDTSISAGPDEGYDDPDGDRDLRVHVH